MILVGACRSEKGPAADTPATVQADGAAESASVPAATAEEGHSTVLPPKPAEDLMFIDLEQGPKGMMYYRGHAFSGSVWMNFDRTYSCTYADGVATAYTYYHSGDHVAAVCSAQGRVKRCYDYEGLVLPPDSFARRYPDMQRFIESTICGAIAD